MSNNPPRLKLGPSFRCTFGPPKEIEFVWPPPPEAIDSFRADAPDEHEPTEAIAGADDDTKDLGLDITQELPPYLPDTAAEWRLAEQRLDPIVETGARSRLGWAVLFVAASCAAISYSGFRAARSPAGPTSAPFERVMAALPAREPEPAPMAGPPAATPPAGGEIAPPPVRVSRPAAVPKPAPRRAEIERREPAARRPPVAPEPSPRIDVRTSTPAPTVQVPRVAQPSPPPRPPAAPREPGPVQASMPAPAPLETRVAEAPAEAATVPVAVSQPEADDEERIRSTLARWRNAYGQLDARAAREVWPSVDVRALEGAFRTLRSQELRFDRCNVTVSGARAQAACRGRAVYVPRLGNQSPKSSSREWTFELTKAGEAWRIASARSS